MDKSGIFKTLSFLQAEAEYACRNDDVIMLEVVMKIIKSINETEMNKVIKEIADLKTR